MEEAERPCVEAKTRTTGDGEILFGLTKNDGVLKQLDVIPEVPPESD